MKKANQLYFMPVVTLLVFLMSFNLASCKKGLSNLPSVTPLADPPALSATGNLTNTVFTTLTPGELLFDNVHYAMGALVYNGSEMAANGQSVGTIPDKKGSADMLYAGTAHPTITGVPPQLIDDKWLMFDNRPNTNYNSLPVAAISPPFEATLVSRNMPGQLFEAKMQNGNNGLYLADIGSPIRVFDALGNVPNSTKAPNYQVIIERIVVKTTGVDYWLNGKYVGTFSFAGTSADAIVANTVKKFHSMGPFTNSMDFDFGALYFKKGIFSDAAYGLVYQSIASKWNVGSTPDQILLSNIRWTNVNGTYTPSATVINTPAGATIADPSKWDYQWYWVDDETNYDTQTLFSTNRTVHTGDFPANDANHHHVAIKFRVRPKDTNGKYWRYLSGTFSEAMLSDQ